MSVKKQIPFLSILFSSYEEKLQEFLDKNEVDSFLPK